MRQVIQRTVRRRLSRQVLWNGNREPPLWTILTDQEHIIRWAWDTHHKTATRVAALLEEHPDLVVVRLTSRSDIERDCRPTPEAWSAPITMVSQGDVVALDVPEQSYRCVSEGTSSRVEVGQDRRRRLSKSSASAW